ncbi:hypothetical protein SRB5_22150 [Streptomyces sp. RB5]|uniref:DUF4328 domain-containing protein n=1 Tax=Streptomyces smaragdinus TaxID=2585196 RepID=A0A7K0CFB6_9ACTN|nr:DUF4328 domain-containing protein [Streptomyces smaragdinus]MQY12086.1 hypothetical protein [Streptomyces smaragdinus]
MTQEESTVLVQSAPRPAMVPVVGAACWTVALLGASAAAQLLILQTNITVWADELDATAARSQWEDTDLLQGLAIVFTASAFLVWFSRCYTNAEHLSPGSQRMRPGWIYLSWLIPFLNWWLPKRMADDIWRASAAGPRILLTTWWATWVGSSVAATAGSVLALDATGAAELRPALAAYLADDVLTLAAAAFGIAAVLRLTAAQRRAFA